MRGRRVAGCGEPVPTLTAALHVDIIDSRERISRLRDGKLSVHERGEQLILLLRGMS